MVKHLTFESNDDIARKDSALHYSRSILHGFDIISLFKKFGNVAQLEPNISMYR